MQLATLLAELPRGTAEAAAGGAALPTLVTAFLSLLAEFADALAAPPASPAALLDDLVAALQPLVAAAERLLAEVADADAAAPPPAAAALRCLAPALAPAPTRAIRMQLHAWLSGLATHAQ